MLRKITFLFIFIFPVCNFLHAQEEEKNEDEETHIVKLSVGLDLAQPVAPLVTDGIEGFGFYFDLEPKKNIVVMGDMGFNTYDIEKSLYSYSSKGSYYKFGVGYDIMKHEKNQAIVGIQYAFSSFTHEMPGLYVKNYWENRYIRFDEEKAQAHWLEFVGGLRVELMKNLFLAYTLRVKINPWTNNDTFTPLYIPGYHKNRGGSSFGISYYIIYRLPLTK